MFPVIFVIAGHCRYDIESLDCYLLLKSLIFFWQALDIILKTERHSFSGVSTKYPEHSVMSL